MKVSRSSAKKSFTTGLDSSDTYSSEDESTTGPSFKEMSSASSMENLQLAASDSSVTDLHQMATNPDPKIERLLQTRFEYLRPTARLIGIWDQLYGKK